MGERIRREFDEHVRWMDVKRLVKIQGKTYLPEEELQVVRKEYGAN